VKISKKAEYALHTILYLSRHFGEARRLSGLAEVQGVSKDYLAKVMQKLSAAGIVTAQPGFGGGYRLAQAPADISLADILREFEEPRGAFICLHRTRDCEVFPDCALIERIQDAVEVFYRELEKTSFEEILKNEQVEQALPSWLLGN
jgi:Rrf2 family transcriptional regulator, nitric oxide-sensitive transcriptional repressor